jgi:hypothetical protein
MAEAGEGRAVLGGREVEEWKGLLERQEFKGEVEEACWDDGKRA